MGTQTLKQIKGIAVIKAEGVIMCHRNDRLVRHWLRQFTWSIDEWLGTPRMGKDCLDIKSRAQRLCKRINARTEIRDLLRTNQAQMATRKACLLYRWHKTEHGQPSLPRDRLLEQRIARSAHAIQDNAHNLRGTAKASEPRHLGSD